MPQCSIYRILRSTSNSPHTADFGVHLEHALEHIVAVMVMLESLKTSPAAVSCIRNQIGAAIESLREAALHLRAAGEDQAHLTALGFVIGVLGR